MQEAVRRWYARIKGIIVEIVRDGIKAGEFRKVDPNTIAELILESSEGSAVLGVLDREDATRKTVANARKKMCLEYLGCDK